MTKLIRVRYNDLLAVDQSDPQAVELEQIASGSIDLPAAGNKAIFLDSLDEDVKVIDSSGVVTPLGGGGAGGLTPRFITGADIPLTMIKNSKYEVDLSAAVLVDQSLVLSGMTNAAYDETYTPVSGLFGSLDASTVFNYDTTYRVFSFEAVAATTWYVAIYDSNGATWNIYTSDVDPATITDAQNLTANLSAAEALVATSETQNGKSVPDSTDAKVSYSGGSALVLTLPTGIGSETFIIGVRVVSNPNALPIQIATNTQNILLPANRTHTSISNFTSEEYIEFAWDGPTDKYYYGDVYDATFADMSNADITFNTVTANQFIGGEATDTQAGLVKKNPYATIQLQVTESTVISDISRNGHASNNGFRFENLEIGQTYRLDLVADIQLSGFAGAHDAALRAYHNGVLICQAYTRQDNVVGITRGQYTDFIIFTAATSEITFNTYAGGGGTFDIGAVGTRAVLQKWNGYQEDTNLTP